MKRFGFLIFVVLIIGVFALIAPPHAEAQGDSGCWNTVAQVWYPTGTVVPSGSRCLGGNMWELNGVQFVGGPWPLPNTQVVNDTNPIVEELAGRVATLEQTLNTQATQIANLQAQVNPIAPEQGAMAENGDVSELPRLLVFITKRPISFALGGTIFLTVIILAAVGIYYWRGGRQDDSPLAAIISPVGDSPLDEAPTAPWATDATGPVDRPIVTIDDGPVD